MSAENSGFNDEVRVRIRPYMRAASCVSEAWRNVCSGTAKTIFVAVAFIVIIVSFGAAEYAQGIKIIDEAKTYQKSGAATHIISYSSKIDAKSCEALAELPNVHYAGAVRSSDDISVPNMPGSNIPAKEVSAGFLPLLDQSLASEYAKNPGGVVLSKDVAEMLNLSVGDDFVSDYGLTKVSAIYSYPDDGRAAGYGYAIVEPVTNTGVFDECWVNIWPQSNDALQMLYLAVSYGDSNSEISNEQASLGKLNSRLEDIFTGESDYRNRLTFYAVPAAFLCAFLLGFIVVRLRRLEFAAALHSGVPLVSLWFTVLCELLPVLFVGIIVWFAVSLAFLHGLLPGDFWALFLQGMAVYFAAISALVLSCSVAVLSVRERHLFKYFKSRA